MVSACLTTPAAARLSHLLAGIVLGVSSLSLLEYFLHIDLGIDQLLIRDPQQNYLNGPPGRMSVLTAGCLILVGLSLWLFAQHRYDWGHAVAIIVLLLSYAVLLGYAFGVNQYYAFGRMSSIALGTSISLLALSIGLLALYPQHGLIKTVRSPYGGGVLLRSVGTYFLLTPPFLTVLYEWVTGQHLLSSATALAMLMLLFVLVTAGLFYRAAYRINGLDEQTARQLAQVIQAERQAEHQATLLTQISQSVQMAVSTHAAVHGPDGQIVDFRYTYFNEQARIWLPVADWQSVVGRTVGEMHFATNVGQTIARMARVVETGQPTSFDATLPNGRVFYNIIARFGDGTVSTFIDVTEQRQREQQQQQQAELLRSVLDGSQNAIIAFDAVRDPESRQIIDFRYVLQNEANRQRVGRPDELLLGRTMLEFFPQVAASGLLDEYVQVVQTGEPLRFEQEFTYDKQQGFFAYSVVKRGDGMVLTVQDKTAEQRAEKQVIQANTMIGAVLDGAQAGIAAYRAVRSDGAEGPSGTITDFVFLSANAAAGRLTGRSAEELVGQRMLTVFPGNREAGTFSRFVSVVETGQPQQFEICYQTDGLNVWFDISAVKRDDGLVLTFLDISDRKWAELERAQKADQLRATLDASLNSIVAMTAIREPGPDGQPGPIVDFMMETANRAVERDLFMRPDQLEGRRLLEVFPGNVENGFFAIYARVTDTGVPEGATLHYTDVNGFNAWFQVSAVQQGPDRVVITFMNVTDNKRQEQQLLESNASLDQFASVASHDLQEPLRKIKSFGNLLQTQYGSALGDGADLLRRMDQAADRMQTLIRALLTYSRLSGDQSMPRGAVDMNRLVGEVLVDLEMMIQEKGAVVDVGNLPILPGNALQLQQVFQNLLSNALKFSRPGDPDRPPRVVIKAAPVNRPDSRLSTMPAEIRLPGPPGTPYWQITVSDNGIGFDAAYRDKIFGAFERLHGRSSQYSGTGIGLAIVRKVIEQHNGVVVADSREGEGATFTIYLPAGS